MNEKRIVLAEYFVTDDATLLFIAREDFKEPHVEEISIPLSELRRLMADHFGTVGYMSGVRDLDPGEWQASFGPFVAPLLSYVKEGDMIWFVPHDRLHYLPLHALQLEGRHLIERNTICYTPSASVMRFCRTKRKGRRENALVLGDSRSDLLYAFEEAIEVATLFGTRPYMRGQATKARVREALAKERDELDILHFSCHGSFRSDAPLKSSIVLAPENGDAGGDSDRWNLTAEEIFGLSLHADLVTLSACETGVSERKPGDELLGLTRALIYAGTPSVIVSLWAVEELSTSLLMQHFYTQLREPPTEKKRQPLTKAEALQAAQLYVKNLTAQQVIDYCNHHLAGLDQDGDVERVLCFLMGRAFAQTMAGDLQQALLGYLDVQCRLQAYESVWAGKYATRVEKAVRLLKFKSRKAANINYDARPFEHMYYWAPFVLVGDWK